MYNLLYVLYCSDVNLLYDNKLSYFISNLNSAFIIFYIIVNFGSVDQILVIKILSILFFFILVIFLVIALVKKLLKQPFNFFTNLAEILFLFNFFNLIFIFYDYDYPIQFILILNFSIIITVSLSIILFDINIPSLGLQIIESLYFINVFSIILLVNYIFFINITDLPFDANLIYIIYGGVFIKFYDFLKKFCDHIDSNPFLLIIVHNVYIDFIKYFLNFLLCVPTCTYYFLLILL